MNLTLINKNNNNRFTHDHRLLLFWVVLLLNTISPHPEKVDYLAYLALLLFYGFAILGFLFLSVKKFLIKDFFVSFGILFFFIFFTVVFSMVKGYLICDVTPKLNDFSSLLKYFYPLFMFFFVLYFWPVLKINDVEKLLILLSIVYISVFIIFLILPTPISFFLKQNRFSGLDYNPNIYSLVACILILYNLQKFLQTKKRLFLIFLLVLTLSVLYSQSRTGVALLGFTFVGSLFLSDTKFGFKIFTAILLAIIGIYLLSLFDFVLLTKASAFSLKANNSFLIRYYNSLSFFNSFEDCIGLLGIGPAKSTYNPSDTVAHGSYLIRYGWAGLISFYLFHFSISFYFFKRMRRFKRNCKKFNYSNPFLIILYNMNILIPFYIIIGNLTRDKWIELKFMFLWMFLLLINFIFDSFHKYFNHAKNTPSQ